MRNEPFNSGPRVPITRPMWPAIGRALRHRCPHCGDAPLFRAYLRQVDACARCGEAWGEVRADDAPPWLTILIVGHIVGPLALFLVQHTTLSDGMLALILLPLALGLVLTILPRAKALFIAVIWAARAGAA